MIRPLVFFGAGGHARELLQIVRDINIQRPSWDPLGFLVDPGFAAAGPVHDLPILGDASWLDGHSDVHVVLAIGSPRVRWRVARHLTERWGCRFASLFHPLAWIAERTTLGEGVVAFPGARISTDVMLGQHVHVNLNATVSHDGRIGDFSSLGPGSCLAGQVTLGEGVELGTGVVAIPRVSVGRWSVVGAGAVVTRPLPELVTAIGCPARAMPGRPLVLPDAP